MYENKINFSHYKYAFIIGAVVALLAATLVAVTSYSEPKNEKIPAKANPAANDAKIEAEKVARLARKETLLVNFSRAGDQFKHPLLYRHKKLRLLKNGQPGTNLGTQQEFNLCATSDGRLHTNYFDGSSTRYGLYVVVDDAMFYISFARYIGEDLNDGHYSETRIPPEKEEHYSDINELSSFLRIGAGRNAKTVALKFSMENKPDIVITLKDEEADSFKQTIELAELLRQRR